jgi:hypothetical protein
MDDHATRLRATIKELEQELQAGGEVDPATRTMLLEAVEEIHSALRTRGLPTTGEPHSLNDRLNTAAADFDASHPALAGLVRRVVDALSQLGI